MNVNEEQLAFYSELGLAITQWATVEHALCIAVQVCFPKENYAALGVGFFSIENFRSKLAYANRVVTRRLIGTDKLKGWQSIVKKAERGSQARNKLVHRVVHVYPDNTNGQRYALVPWISKKPKSDEERVRPPAGSWFLNDVIQARLNFFATFVALNNFADRARGMPELMSNLKTRMPTETEVVRSLHAMLGHAKGA